MKVFKILLISCFMLIAAQSFAFAGSGKAIVPHWYVYTNGADKAEFSHIFISNITKNNLTVKVTLYNMDGTKYQGAMYYYNLQNNDSEIAAGKSGYFQINANTTNVAAYGYAVIEWQNKDNDDDTIGLVAWADWARAGDLGGYAVTVNDGKPF